MPAAVAGSSAGLQISIDGDAPKEFVVEVGRQFELPLTLPHGGMNVLQFTVLPEEGELTDRNNAAVVSINGVRDRLRVLLVSGEPHAGERTWRNLLKSDSAVDLVHFTILRSPDKQDGVPVRELSLIAFPTRELFLEKIDEFDLIIFDRYRRRGHFAQSLYGQCGGICETGRVRFWWPLVLRLARPGEHIAHAARRQFCPRGPSARVIEAGLCARHFRDWRAASGDRGARTDFATASGGGRWHAGMGALVPVD